MSQKYKFSLVFCCLVMAFAAGFLFSKGAPPAFPLDDAYIHLTYARNLAQGQGFSFNPGEPSFGTTSPLWVLLLATGIKWIEPHLLLLVLSWASLGICLCLAALMTAQNFAAKFSETRKAGFDRWFFPLISAALLAFSGNFLWIVFSGMESAFWVALILAAIYFAIRKQPTWAGYGLLGLAMLCRMEAILLLPLVLLWQLASGKDRRKAVAGAAVALVIGLSFYVYAHFKLGSFFPTTRAGKLAADLFNSGVSLKGGLVFLKRHLLYLRLTQPGTLAALLLALLALAGRLVLSGRKKFGPAGITAIFALLVFAYHDQFFRSAATVTPFHNFRYQVMFFPALALGLAGIGGEIYAALKQRWARGLLAAAMLCLLAIQGFRPWHELYLNQCRHIQEVHIRAADFCRSTLPANARIASFDIGSLGFFSNRHVIDLGGLVDPKAHQYLRARRLGPYLEEMRASHYIELGTPGSDRLLGVSKDVGVLYELGPLAYFAGQRIREPVMLHSWEMKIFEVRWIPGRKPL